MRPHALPSTSRLKKRRDFACVERQGRYFAVDKIVIQWMRSTHDSARLGLTVSCRFGSAVQRNLFRRRAREAFRTSTLKTIPGIDLNVKPRGKICASYDEFCQAFQRFEQIVSNCS